jgi:multidrug efflux pump subunit AcrA (membrane-fusion protein)
VPQDLENNNQILYETRSGEVQELIGKMPSWLLRYGIFIVGIILVSIFIAAAYIKYPDKVMIPILIEQSKPPIAVVSKSSGVIKEIFVKENDSVQINQPIAMLMTEEDQSEVDVLDNLLKQGLSSGNLQSTFYPKLERLGSFQLQYFELQNKVKLYRNYLQNNGDQIKLNEIENQWKANIKAIQLKTNIGKIKSQTNTIEYQQFEEDKRLYEQNAITKQEYLESKKRYLSTQVSSTVDNNDITSAQQELTKLSLSKLTLLNEKEQQLFNMRLELNTIALSISQAIENWRNQNTIKATGNGRVLFNPNFKTFTNVNMNSELVRLVDSKQELKVNGYLPINNSGDVKVGQMVWLDIASFPASKHGYFNSQIISISEYPLDSVYLMQLVLKDSFKTTTGETLPNKPILQGSGNVITKDISVLERLFDKLKFKTNG